MKNVVFDLGGVLFARDMNKCTQEFADFFSYVRAEQMPEFWENYDRGVLTLDEVTDILCELKGCTREKCSDYIWQSINMQETVKCTEQLVVDLKTAGYKLYVLSNMASEFIAFLRGFPVYALFDGEVVSCEERTVKPESRIYEILLERYGLDPSQTLFVDDRKANIVAAENTGLNGYLFDYRDPAASCSELRRRLL